MKKQQNDLTLPQNPNLSVLPLDKSIIKDEEWLSIKDIMRYLNISRSTVNRLVQGNKIPSIKLGGTLVFPKHLINNILQNQSLKDLDISEYNH
ncbi:helix-turn-helix domain-containing protein [Psychroserpens mesophilus]|uniref:helix-turn-helix domain-containing protein n=1 Tax=Psychroserpens mesophilus TaxID=325473 RepID=UPI003D65FADF